MKKVLLFFACVFSLSSFAQDDNFDELIGKLFKVEGLEKTWETIILQAIDQQKELYPNIDTAFWNMFEEQMLTDAYTQLLKSLVPVYKKYLTINEIKAMIAFYETDEGKSIVEKTPMIMQESMVIGAKYGKELSEYIVNDLQNRVNTKMLKNFDGCEHLKTGKFKTIMPDSSEVIIQRDEKYQYEYYQNTTTKYKIEWLDDCRYTLDIVKTDNEIMKAMKGHILTVNIFEISNSGYKYVCSVDNGKSFEGILYIIQ